MLRFSLLGPVQLTLDGTPVPSIAPRHRAVLAYLLLNAGRVISIERLIEAMWGHDMPDTARSQIHASITAIRKALRGAGAEGLLETRAGGYVARPEPAQVDAQEFTELVAAGALREALGLWSGEALEGVHAHYVAGSGSCGTSGGCRRTSGWWRVSWPPGGTLRCSTSWPRR